MSSIKLEDAINRLRVAVLKRRLARLGKTLSIAEIGSLLNRRTDKDAFIEAVKTARPIKPASFWDWIFNRDT